jgi:hypothetical protein
MHYMPHHARTDWFDFAPLVILVGIGFVNEYRTISPFQAQTQQHAPGDAVYQWTVSYDEEFLNAHAFHQDHFIPDLLSDPAPLDACILSLPKEDAPDQHWPLAPFSDEAKKPNPDSDSDGCQQGGY